MMTGIAWRLSRVVVMALGAMIVSGLAMPPAAATSDGDGSACTEGRVTVSFDRDAFLAVARVKATQDFAEPIAFPPEKRTAMFSGVKFWSMDEVSPSWGVSDGALWRTFAGTGGPNDTADVAISFRSGGAVRWFGMHVYPVGTAGGFVVKIVETNGTVTKKRLPDVRAPYVGVHSRCGIARVVLTQPPELNDGYQNFAIDDVARSYIMFG